MTSKRLIAAFRRSLCLGLALCPVWAAGAEDFGQAARQLQARYESSVRELAGWCDQQGLNAQAEKTRACLLPHDPYKLYLAIIPQQVAADVLPADAPPLIVQWKERLGRLRTGQAEALLELARRAVRGGRAALGYDLLLEALRADPDQETVRRLLSFQKVGKQWCTAYEAGKLEAGQVWDRRFGWILPARLPRYEEGKRYYAGRWISAAEDARVHQDIRTGWRVESEHFVIRTNHSLEAGVELGRKLEKLYGVWRQLFVRYYASEAQVTALFEGRSPWPSSRHQVVYYHDQEEYNRGLRAIEPNIGITIGIYLQRTHQAYFFPAQPPDDRTLFHEATHQLFQETRPVARGVGLRANWWIVEGIAMYVESLREENGCYVLGGFDDVRMHAAAYRLLESKFYVPLAEFAGYGMEQLQHDPRIATLYSQAAGLTHFLMHFDGGRYREALMAYLSLIYSGRDQPGSLAVLTGTPFAALDGQYRQFVEEGVKRQAAGSGQPAGSGK